jgi:hydroxymethylglutaryl-CoA reductase (NADPH)
VTSDESTVVYLDARRRSYAEEWSAKRSGQRPRDCSSRARRSHLSASRGQVDTVDRLVLGVSALRLRHSGFKDADQGLCSSGDGTFTSPRGRQTDLPSSTSTRDGDRTPKNGQPNGQANGHVIVPPKLLAPTPPAKISTHSSKDRRPNVTSDESTVTVSVMMGTTGAGGTIIEIFAGGVGANNLSDEEVILLVEKGKVAPYALEKALKNLERAVRIRRAVISRVSLTQTLEASALPVVAIGMCKS